MNKTLKTILYIACIIIAFISSFILTYYIVYNISNNIMINEVSNTFTADSIQNRIENANTIDNLVLTINENTVIGTLEINKISFKGLVYEGTDLSTLKIGVGHFSSSPLVDGNVCFAAHNTSKFWKNLHKLEKNDIITYTNIAGKMDYRVFNIIEIDETNFDLLQNTQKNIITLITCVKNNPQKRLCVQAERI